MKALLQTGPTIEPVSPDQLADHVLLDSDHPDRTNGFITDIEKTARQHVEDITRRALLTQTWDYYLDAFPSVNFITLPLGRLQSVTSIVYKDSDGDSTTMTANTEYLVETNGDGYGRVVLPDGESWPGDALYPSNPITIKFVCGWTAANSVPFQIRTAIKMLAADMYENRGDTFSGNSLSIYENPMAMNLLASWRLWGEF